MRREVWGGGGGNCTSNSFAGQVKVKGQAPNRYTERDCQKEGEKSDGTKHTAAAAARPRTAPRMSPKKKTDDNCSQLNGGWVDI